MKVSASDLSLRSRTNHKARQEKGMDAKLVCIGGERRRMLIQ